MVLVASIFFGISTGCVAWALVHRQQSQRLITQRISAQASPNPVGVAVGDYVGSLLKSKKIKGEEITLENMNTSIVSRDLFLAGIYDVKIARFFQMLIKLSAWIPLLLIGVDIVTGHFTMPGAFKNALVGLVIFIYVHLALRMGKQKRQKKILRRLPQTLDLLVVCVEAGLGFAAALERILKELDANEPLTKEFRLMYHEYLGGLSLGQACERMDKRCGVTDLSLLLTSIMQSDHMGASLGDTLRAQASEIRDKQRQRLRAKAMKIPVKILFPTLFIFGAFMIFNFGIVGYQMIKALGNTAMSQTTAAMK